MNNRFMLLAIFYMVVMTNVQAESLCKRSKMISDMSVTNSLQKLRYISDVKRNFKSLNGLCVNLLEFQEGRYRWQMLLVTHPKAPKGAFWFLPHDNENSAFSSAVYATRRYGGGFLAIVADGQRYFKQQDPNRNFGDTASVANHCSRQNYPAPKYSKIIFGIIDSYRSRGMPYLALHNNTNGGGISILKSTNSVHSYPAYKTIKDGGGLSDEDSLIYIAGSSRDPDKHKLDRLLSKGLNVRYEVVNKHTNDCSMSNYVILNKHTDNYFNIEAQHGDTKTQKKMVDILMKSLR